MEVNCFPQALFTTEQKTCELGGISSGGGNCKMPEGFTYEFYYANRKLVFSQSSPSAKQ